MTLPSHVTEFLSHLSDRHPALSDVIDKATAGAQTLVQQAQDKADALTTLLADGVDLTCLQDASSQAGPALEVLHDKVASTGMLPTGGTASELLHAWQVHVAGTLDAIAADVIHFQESGHTDVSDFVHGIEASTPPTEGDVQALFGDVDAAVDTLWAALRHDIHPADTLI